jgi:hypothetical protein
MRVAIELFYHLKLRSFVVVELKSVPFVGRRSACYFLAVMGAVKTLACPTLAGGRAPVPCRPGRPATGILTNV